MITSVGQGQQITDVIPALAEILPHPIMTLESVQLCKRDGALLSEPPRLPPSGEDGFDVLQKLEIYSGVHSRYGHHPLDLEIVQALR
jgi:hypothetical protein